MISRRSFLASAAALLPAAKAATYPVPIGLELYSLRDQADQDLPGTLALARQMGFEEVEVSSVHKRTAAAFRRLLDDAGLKATSMMAEYAALAKSPAAVAQDAHAVGAGYVVAGTIPHRGKRLAVEDTKPAAATLNRAGEALLASGLRLCYHTHGVEFSPAEGGTVFDTLAREMDSKYANFEMDIFWIVYAHQDPVAMIERYRGRFPLFHLKDIRKGTKLGGLPADVREEESVVLGQGIVDFPAALRAARETGALHYYIEDEAFNAAEQIPGSLKYLKSIRL